MPSLGRFAQYAVTIAVVAAAIVAGWWLWRLYEDTPWTRDGRVRANVVNVAPDVAGAVIDLRVKDNQQVKIGDILFVVDPARYQLALEEAEATAAGAKATLDERQEEQDRREKLSAAAISVEALNQARSATLEARAAYDQAVAQVGVAKLNLARTNVRSPVNGHVTNLLLNRGDYVTAGKPVLAVVDQDSFYIAGYFEETKLRFINLGDAVSIRLLGYDAPLKGHVESVARAITDRENVIGTDLIANVNPTFSWVRLAQRIPVRIAIDYVPEGITLSAGMTATLQVTAPAPQPDAAVSVSSK
ncbi:efflux RND transporter periplasmic adaptor subunit [Bradyrhizobium neotropicale]|uniref:efflux RND transporter periplasmic adaptor subunit n=1 Tax=Bradyrhizobium neotropicale TaxID=1497615 RepID=UPI001AD73005|nr:efflux RND transporter periplasmic adaptor subunit [Bradyrhizobium neotropicale]MBO4221345.1 efflux RND transporter periplasmic adaptor subunit [Bradyrhizobium neotropicale]